MSNLYYKKYKNFFLSLKNAYKKKQKFFIYPSKNEHLIVILKKLQENSFIASYVFGNEEFIEVFLRYDLQNLPAINYLFLLPEKRFISSKQLKLLKNDYPLSLSLINTKFGILDTKECQKKNCGGELIVIIT